MTSPSPASNIASDLGLAPFGEAGGEGIAVSFEVFPPRDDAAEASLRRALTDFAAVRPRFISVTYGAGGRTRDRTHGTAAWIAQNTDAPAAGHLTCVGASKAEIAHVAEAYWEAGIRHIVALRGDPPVGTGAFQPHAEGYASAAELVRGLLEIAPFEISVAAYPEVHPEAASADADLDNLKRKLDAGAARAITQLFFSPEAYLRFRDRAVAAGITAEIAPGIMPVTNVASTRRFAEQCGATIPDWMDRLFEGLDQRPTTRQLVAATIAAELCRRLKAGGAHHFHFYTLNRTELVLAVCHLLGRREAALDAQVAA